MDAGIGSLASSSSDVDMVDNTMDMPYQVQIPTYDPSLAALYYILLAIAPVAVVGNGLTYKILRDDRSGFDDVMKKILNSLTASYAVFAIGEALVSLLQIAPLDLNVKEKVCMYQAPLIYMCLFLTISLTCLLNINRYITVTRPLRHHLIVTDRRASVMIGVVIAKSVLLTIPMTPFPGTPAEQLQRHSCMQNEDGTKGSYYLIFLIAYVVLGAGVTIISTVRLLGISRRQSKAIAGFRKHTGNVVSSSGGTKVTGQSIQTVNTSASNSNSDGSDEVANITKKQHSRNRRAFLTIFTLNIVVIFSWIPLIIFYILAFGGVKVSPILKCIMMISIMSTTCWHWLIYITTNKVFRETTLSILKKFRANLSW
nr:rhodopsin, GQ-coupled-like [Lytechinus pictus]